MKSITGWWFAPTNKKLTNGDGRKIQIGVTHKVTGEIIPCRNGLHLSKRLIDALNYAPGPIIYKVKGSGIIIPHNNPIDKYVCSERTYISGGIDCTDILNLFARKCALDVVHLWDAPKIVIEYLWSGDESLRLAVCTTKWSDLPFTEWGTARSAAIIVAKAATRGVEWDLVVIAMRNATYAITRSFKQPEKNAAKIAYMDKINKRLTAMITKYITQQKIEIKMEKSN